METATIQGNGNSGKTAIENAGYVKNTSQVTWDKDSKIAQIRFDSQKTSLDAVLKQVALAGFDNDSYLAPDKAYQQLEASCSYERIQKMPAVAVGSVASTLDMSGMEMSMETNLSMQTEDNLASPKLAAIFGNYFELNNALIKTNVATAALKSAAMLDALEGVHLEDFKAEEQILLNKVLPSLRTAAKSISIGKDIKQQREDFKMLSSNMHDLLPIYHAQETIYYQYCPMQDANWLSLEKAIKNPYYGSQMLSCGSTIETINPSLKN